VTASLPRFLSERFAVGSAPMPARARLKATVAVVVANAPAAIAPNPLSSAPHCLRGILQPIVRTPAKARRLVPPSCTSQALDLGAAEQRSKTSRKGEHTAGFRVRASTLQARYSTTAPAPGYQSPHLPGKYKRSAIPVRFVGRAGDKDLHSLDWSDPPDRPARSAHATRAPARSYAVASTQPIGCSLPDLDHRSSRTLRWRSRSTHRKDAIAAKWSGIATSSRRASP
jgi:hypothetical protein